MSAIARALAAGLSIEYGRRIESLAELQQQFDRIIVAVSPVEAQRLTGTHYQVNSRSCWTVLAAFEERVAARFDAAFVNGSALGWIARNTSKPKRNYKIDAWVLHASTSWSDAHVNDQPDDVGAFLMEAFDDLMPSGLPKAFYATVHRWRFATADPALAVGAITDDRAIVCGDWCRGTRVEDAYLSGLAAAENT